MDILISTNMYQASEFEQVFEILNRVCWEGIGVEIFPMFHKPEYEEILIRSLRELAPLPISFHGPYYQTEHSAPQGSFAYERSMSYFDQTLKFARALKSKYMVFHHNNCKFSEDEKPALLVQSDINMKQIADLCDGANIPLVIENAGVMDRGNMLLNEEEFTALCLSKDHPVLIDIGHAHANGWSLERVMKRLKHKIISYHIHNNDGIHDAHRRISDGTLDFNKFLSDYQKLTPDADLVLEYSMDIASDKEGILADLLFLKNALRETVGLYPDRKRIVKTFL